MEILDIKKAIELDVVSSGAVLINAEPQVRSGRKNDFMVGTMMTADGTAEFKIWEERTFDVVRQNGPGIYEVEVCGSEYNGVYLTVRRIRLNTDPELSVHDFLPAIPMERLTSLWKDVSKKLTGLGVSYACWALVEELTKDPELGGRFYIEGAAIMHHDNKIGGLIHHTTKMLNYLAALLENQPELEAVADLLCLGIILHDIGKVFEYHNLSPGDYWYANHRVRGIELFSKYKEKVIAQYDEEFYRQLQSIISGHHGEYGDRPTTVAAGIVHYIDTLESQVTGLIEEQLAAPGSKLRFADWGWIHPLPLGKEKN